jgi:hypothetical protein
MINKEQNMVIWNAVEKTDPQYTKKVTFGRGFTSIDPQYQIMRMTELFGPVGQGWGYVVDHSTLAAGAALLAVADVSIWIMQPDGKGMYGPVRGLDYIVSEKGKIDEDAPKKAMTDALTKALSHLGLGADVFLGKFDDNRYVAKMNKEFSEKNAVAEAKKEENPRLNQIVDSIKDCKTKAEVEALKASIRTEVAQMPKANGMYLATVFKNHEATLGE